MPKPIGNQVANLRPNDKVSHKTLARFGSQPSLKLPSGQGAAKAKAAPAKPKYKTRKK
jgi:hypothetical protein